ncbi:phage tail protein [Paucilactobacillus sp. N302-9]
MAGIGLKMLYTGTKDASGQTIVDAEKGLSEEGVYAVDTDKSKGNLGSKTANITGLAGTPVKIPGNNEIADTTNPPSAPTVAWDANLINYLVKQKLLGRVSNGKGGYSDGDEPVESGLIIESQSPITYKSIYFCFGRGIFNEASQNLQTNTDTAETREDDNLTYTALTYDKFNGKPYRIYFADDPKFDKQAMFDEVFPGQTLITGDTGENPKVNTPVSVTGVTLSVDNASIEVGKTAKVSSKVTPTNATNKTVSYKSSDDRLATVDNGGTVIGVAAGNVTITGTADGKTGTVDITVTAKTE